MILVDTGAWLALAGRGDAYHVRSREFFRRNREPLMTSYPVLVECVHLMFSRIGVTKTLAWMETLGALGGGRLCHGGGSSVPAVGLDAPVRRFADGFGRCVAGATGRRIWRGAHRQYRRARFSFLSLEKPAPFPNSVT